MDPYDLLDAVDISSQIPNSFFTLIESKKWAERKEALDSVEKATSVPKIQNSDYNELVRILKKTVAKDSNVVVATLAAKCLCQLAQGLRSDFSPHAHACIGVIFEKFKEKKPNVVATMRDAADAVFVGTNIENIMEDLTTFLDNKNPQIRSEIALFLARAFSKYPGQVMNKKTLRPIINSLIKTLSDMDATVRENSAMAIGTAMKVTGDKLMMTLIADVEPIKLPKIKEYCDKAVIEDPQQHQVVVGVSSAPSNSQATDPINGQNGVADDDEDDDERMYEMLEAVEIINQIPVSFYTQIDSKKWSERKEALDLVEKATSVPKIQNADYNELVRILKKTVAKDSNVVVATLAAKCLCQLAQGLRTNFSPHANSTIAVIFEKFKEKKPNVVAILRDAADAAFVGTNIENILEDLTTFLDNKNPQIKSEIALFLARAFAKYPIQVMNKKTLRPVINSLIKTLSDMDATVRENSALAIGTAMKVTGEKLMMTLIADVEPIKLPKIKEYCEKAEVKKIPRSQLNSAPSTTTLSSGTQENTQAPPAAFKSSATMIRSKTTTSGNGLKKPLGSKLGSRASLAPPSAGSNSATSNSNNNNSGATVKRTATIIKRAGTAAPNKRASVAAMPPPMTQQQQQQFAPTQITAPTNNYQHQIPSAQNNTNSHNNNTNNNNNNYQGQPHAVPMFQPNNNNNQIINNHSVTPAKPTIVSSINVKPSKQDQLDLLLFRLISNKHEDVIGTLNDLDDMLTKDERSIDNRINQLLDLCCLQLIKSIGHFKQQSLTGSENQFEQQSQVLEKVCLLLTRMFASHQQLVTTASQQSIRFLIVQIFTLTQTQNGTQSLSNHPDLGACIKLLNNLASSIMDAFEPANMMCILTGILNDPSPTSIVEPIKQAIIRSMRSFQ